MSATWRMPREQLAEIHAADAGGDRGRRAAILAPREGLGIVGLEVAGPPDQPDDDHRRPLSAGIARLGAAAATQEVSGPPGHPCRLAGSRGAGTSLAGPRGLESCDPPGRECRAAAHAVYCDGHDGESPFPRPGRSAACLNDITVSCYGANWGGRGKVHVTRRLNFAQLRGNTANVQQLNPGPKHVTKQGTR